MSELSQRCHRSASAAILDRFLQDARLIEITGKSYRMRGKRSAETDTVQTRSAAPIIEKHLQHANQLTVTNPTTTETWPV